MPIIAPSILNANFLKLGEAIEMVNESEADMIHLDIMDGYFVPNISFGFPVIKQIKSIARKPLDVHLMITDPDRYLERFREAGADNLTVHFETCPHLHRTVQRIRELGMTPSVVVNPHTARILPRRDTAIRVYGPDHVGQSGFWRTGIYLTPHTKRSGS